MKKIDIIIVNWNAGEYLKNCVDSLIRSNSNFINKIIIVDNFSSDNSIEKIQNYKFIQIIKEKKNHGFAKGCNIGASKSKSKYLLFLNPDCEVYGDTIKKVINFMCQKKNSHIGICGVKMVDKFENTVLSASRFPSIQNILLKSLGLEIFFKSKSTLMRDMDHEKSNYVDQVIGAFFLVRNDIFKKIKGFDERFFLYMDEVDFSYRVRKIGYKSYYLSSAKCYHEGGVSSDKNLLLRNFNSQKSKLLYGLKHFNYFSIFILIIVIFIIEPFSRAVFYTLKLSFKDLRILVITELKLLNFFICRK